MFRNSTQFWTHHCIIKSGFNIEQDKKEEEGGVRGAAEGNRKQLGEGPEPQVFHRWMDDVRETTFDPEHSRQ